MMFKKEQIFRETGTKRLVFNSNCPGNKYYVYKKITWTDKSKSWESWECLMAFGTQGEANTYFDKVNDLPCERNYHEWVNTWVGQEMGE